jgi:flavin-dependent dehydrogenase
LCKSRLLGATHRPHESTLAASRDNIHHHYDLGIPWTDGHTPWKGHAYHLYDHASPVLGDDGVLLVGDAAGLACAQSGEGIRPAFESGLIAAGVMLGASENDGCKFLQTYQPRLEGQLGKPRQTIRPAARLWRPDRDAPRRAL